MQKSRRKPIRIRAKKNLIDRMASWVWLSISAFIQTSSKQDILESNLKSKVSSETGQKEHHLDLSAAESNNETKKHPASRNINKKDHQEHRHIEVQTVTPKPREKTDFFEDNKSIESNQVIQVISSCFAVVSGTIQTYFKQSQIVLLRQAALLYKRLPHISFLHNTFISQRETTHDKARKKLLLNILSFLVGGVLLVWSRFIDFIELIVDKIMAWQIPEQLSRSSSQVNYSQQKSFQTPNTKHQDHPQVGPENTTTTLKHMIKKRIPKRPMKKTEKKTRGFWLWRWLKNIALTTVALGFVGAGIFMIWVATLEIPDSNIDDIIQSQSTKIYDSTGEVLLHDVYGEERRTVVSLSEISPNMQKAILATEDDEFYEHGGYDVSAIMRGVCYEFSRVIQMDTFGGTCPRGGGSTITQQVIKNTLLNADRKLERKVKEVVLARKLEKQKTKDEILEIYLNEIAFGGPIYGVEQASLSLFGKSASEVTIAESAYLAALPKAPTTYLNNKARFDGRQQFILGRMRDQKFITQAQYDEAVKEEVEFRERVDRGIKAPHFVFYVLEEIDKKLSTDEEALNLGGYKIQTTLDWELQQELEEVVKSQSERISSQYGASNLAVVAVENKTGKIKAMVGSKDYFAEDIDGKFNIATALRQPGSTFKPFVYANAFEKGYLPETILWDTNTEFSTSCYPDGTPQLPQYADRCYSPQNYDKSFRGPISMRNALAQSLNIPAVKALYLVGISDSMKLARDLGITSLTRSPNFYGLNLVLGGGEVQLIEMANAYGTFANGGSRATLSSWESIVDADSEIVDEYEVQTEQVLSSQVAAMVNDVLSDDNAKRPVFGANSRLYYGSARDVAVKTGTTNNFKDVWTVGYSSDITIAVWAGNNDNTPLARAPSSRVVGPFWREAMDVALKYYDSKRFAGYSLGDTSGLADILVGNYGVGGVTYIDPNTGDIVPEPTEEELEAEIYQRIDTRSYHSILHYVNKNNPRSGVPNRSDSLYEHFEYGVQNWVKAEGLITEISTSTINDLIDEINQIQGGDIRLDNNDEPDQEPDFDFTITSPVSGSVVSGDERITIGINITGDVTDAETIYYYLNNSYLDSGTYRETSVEVTPNSVRDIAKENTIKVIVQKIDGTRIEKTSSLIVE